jgi:hypothetical protein
MPKPDDRRSTDPAQPAIVVAQGLVEGIRGLMPGCTVAAISSVGATWQMLAHAGTVELAPHWPRAAADRVRVTDRAEHDAGYLIAPFSAVELPTLLIVAPERGHEIPPRLLEHIRPLLDGGGVLLDRAVAAQRRDRLVRRIVSECRLRNGLEPRSLPDLEIALARLWPDAIATHHPAADVLANCDWGLRRLLRNACELNDAAIGRSPSHDGLLPPDTKSRIAIPAPRDGGAILIETGTAGELPDRDSIATATMIAAAPLRPRTTLRVAEAQHTPR